MVYITTKLNLMFIPVIMHCVCICEKSSGGLLTVLHITISSRSVETNLQNVDNAESSKTVRSIGEHLKTCIIVTRIQRQENIHRKLILHAILWHLQVEVNGLQRLLVIWY